MDRTNCFRTGERRVPLRLCRLLEAHQPNLAGLVSHFKDEQINLLSRRSNSLLYTWRHQCILARGNKRRSPRYDCVYIVPRPLPFCTYNVWFKEHTRNIPKSYTLSLQTLRGNSPWSILDETFFFSETLEKHIDHDRQSADTTATCRSRT